MKKWRWIALGFFAGMALVSQPVYSVDSTEDEVAGLQKSIDEMTQRVRANLHDSPDSKGSVIVMGLTGSGKTTTIAYLTGSSLLAKKQEDGDWVLDNPDFPIGHTFRPGTVLPNVWHDSENHTFYWDFFGLEDPRGAKEDIINAFSTVQLFGSPSSIKVLLVVEEPALCARRGGDFLSLLDKMDSFFHDNEQLKECLSLVVTKKTKINPQIRFEQMLNDEQLNGNEHLQNPRVRDLLQFLANNATTRVAVFPYPQALGDYDEESRQAILEVIRSAKFIAKPTVNMIVSDRSRQLTSKLAQKLNNALTDYIRAQGSEQIINYCLRKIDAYEAGTIQDLREQLLGLATALEVVGHTSPETPMVFADCLSSFFDVEDIRAKINTIGFLKKINPDVTYQTGEWFQALNDVLLGLRDVIAVPPSVHNPIAKEGILELKGTCLGISDVNNALNALKLRQPDTPVNEVHVKVWNTFFFDEDITAPGLLIGLITPAFKVLGEIRKVNLRGADGNHGNKGEDGVAGDGEPGEPGQHGGHGGHFYGKAHTFSRLDRLTINTSGGNGGNGGNGGKGANGVDGVDGDWNKKVCTQSVSVEGPLLDDPNADPGAWKETYHKVSCSSQGTNGTAGHNGGQGGQRGNGGFAGTALIEGCGEVPWVHVSQNGVLGDHDGNPGAFGVGGVHGADLTGTAYTGRYRWHHKRVRTHKEWARYSPLPDIMPPGLRTTRGTGRANNGNPGQKDLNIINQRPQARIPTPLNDEGLCQAYRADYDQQLALPVIGPFVKAFPNR